MNANGVVLLVDITFKIEGMNSVKLQGKKNKICF